MRKTFIFFTISLFLISCSHSPGETSDGKPVSTPFIYTENTSITIPVSVNGMTPKNFILDTGAGINIISKSICESIGCQTTSQFSGKRMSGQEIKVPMSIVSSLEISGLKKTHLTVGIFDMQALAPGTDIEGIISLAFFEHSAVTIDYKHKTLTIETKSSLRNIKREGVVVPVQIDRKLPSLGVLMPLILSDHQQIHAEVDTGSQALILHERYMKPLGIPRSGPSVKIKTGKDETGHSYTRYFSKIKGKVSLPKSDDLFVESIDVMFQKIIYDGLVGHYFLRNFNVTYNLPESEMIFRKP
jgi:predicted aspartyl protease